MNVTRLALQLSLPNPLKPGVENEDVVGAAPTGDAPTTCEWSTISLLTNSPGALNFEMEKNSRKLIFSGKLLEGA